MLDFGLASDRSSGGKEELAGTLAYIAPELFRGDAPSIKSDLWALGVLFQTSILGRHPIEVDPSTDLAGYLDSALSSPPALSLPPAFPPRLAEWLGNLRAPNPQDRPSGARESLAQFKEILGPQVVI
jgi:serine/threonine protein kinase